MLFRQTCVTTGQRHLDIESMSAQESQTRKTFAFILIGRFAAHPADLNNINLLELLPRVFMISKYTLRSVLGGSGRGRQSPSLANPENFRVSD